MKCRRKMGFSVLHAIAVIFSMSFVPASFVIFLVEERVSKAKHLQFVSGVKPFTFWISTYTWDLVRLSTNMFHDLFTVSPFKWNDLWTSFWLQLNYVIPSFLCVLIFIAFDQEAYVGPRNIIGMILLLLFYGWVLELLCFIGTEWQFSLQSGVHTSDVSCQFGFWCSQLCFRWVGLCQSLHWNYYNHFFLRASTVWWWSEQHYFDRSFRCLMSHNIHFSFQQLKFIGSILNQVYFIFPHYCLGRGLMDMAQQHFVAKKFDTFGLFIHWFFYQDYSYLYSDVTLWWRAISLMFPWFRNRL